MPPSALQTTGHESHQQTAASPSARVNGTDSSPGAPKPIALVVFLENVGHIHGVNLPQWAMNIIDFVTEEYAKILLRLYGAHRKYDRVVILEDEQATGAQLQAALLATSATHRVDLLLLVHGHAGMLVGHRGQEQVNGAHFAALREQYAADAGCLDLRMVYGVNCYGASLAPIWLDLGAQVANGALGVNWMPEPSLSIFLRNWLNGQPFGLAVHRSNRAASRFWNRVLSLVGRAARRDAAAVALDHPAVASSRQIIYGHQDITLNG